MISDQEKQNDANALNDAFQKGESAFSEAARTLFDKYQGDEAYAAWICGYCYERKSDGCIPLIFKFMELYHNSVYPIRVIAAEIMQMNGDSDSCSETCRFHLRLMKEIGKFPNTDKNEPQIQFGICNALYLLPCSSLNAGACNYSYRLLSYALEQLTIPEIATAIKNLQQKIDDMLDDDEIDALDRKWEAFYSKGEYHEFLVKHCRDAGLKLLADRVDALWRHIAVDSSNYNEQDAYLWLTRYGKTEDGRDVKAIF
jgi:hypothetical protein